MLTTVHDDSVVTKQRRTRAAPEDVRKPVVIVQYNEFMGGVDHGDQLLSYYGFSHRTLKWWRRALFYLVEVAIVNAYIMYWKAHDSQRVQSPAGKGASNGHN